MKHRKVNLFDLKGEWEMSSHVRFLQCSGCRFDSPSWEGPEEWGIIRNQDLWETFDKVLMTCQEEHIDLLFLTGNLFEQDYVRKSTVDRVAKSLETLTKTKIFIIPGEKDPLIATSAYRLTIWPNNVHIFSNEMSKVEIPSLKVTVYGAGWTAYKNESFYFNEFRATDDGTCKIMLLHTEIAPSNETKGFVPITEDQIALSNLAYLALGHRETWSGIHKVGTTVWADSGILEARSFSEEGPHGIIIGEIDENSVGLEFRQLGQRQYVQKDYELQSNMESFISALLTESSPEERQRDLYRVRLSGGDSNFDVKVQQLYKLLADKFRYVEILPLDDKPDSQFGLYLSMNDDTKNKKATNYLTLNQLFSHRLEERLKAATGSEDQAHWEFVKKIGLTALEQGRIDDED